ncbi:MAG TPA: KEOPS complex subunit Pcc1 [Candidatus Nanoarchaeia archaeon]|nr:KEOPS complex subunit Pcc1 [Candidatus Nanoarchaeia archaeon]
MPRDFYEVLKPEEAETKRFTVRVDKKSVTITATDAHALKSITTSLLRLIEVAEKIHNG